MENKLDNKLINIIYRVLQIIGSIFFVASGLLLSVNVILRLFFKVQISGTYELVGYCAAFFASCAYPIASMFNEHIVIDLFFNKMGKKVRLGFAYLAKIIDILVSLFFVYSGYTVAVKYISKGEVTDALKIVKGPGRIMWIVSGVAMTIVYIWQLIRLKQDLAKAEHERREQDLGEEPPIKGI